jgi:pyruvate-formate lyase-activating enzyme
MKLPNNKFCVLPWISLEASPIGTVRPCCLADDEIVDDSGKKFKLIDADFSDIQNSQYMRQLRKEFLEGQQPKTCRKCWNEEKSGRTSKRMHTLNRLKHIVPDQEWTEETKPLLFLDLKLGNICNLKCRICGSWSSSQFAAEELNWTAPDERKNTFAYQMLRAGAWPQDENSKFWQQIDRHLNDIRYIEFTGGEPFMIQQHFTMLQGIVDKGIAAQVEIHYNTNGTHFPEQAEEIWKHFRLVEIAFSIDDVGERFEYQRTNAVWSEVCNNIEKFKKLKERYSNIVLQICTTVNVFNVRYLDQVATWIDSNRESFNFIYWNMMHDAWYFSISTLPADAKKHLTQHLTTCTLNPEWRQEFDRILEFMNRGADSDGTMLRMKIRDLDRKRGQNLATVAPEFAALVAYDFNDPDPNAP